MRDEDDKPTPDSDRAAILARRKQFIALALSGLTTTAACTDGKDAPGKKPNDQPTEQKAQPCLSVPPPEPHACLSVEPLPEPEVPPQPCLKVAPPEPEPEHEVRPHVCLKIARPEPEPEPQAPPQPCLSKPVPQPCLKKAVPDSE
jgi:hypothetical protein